MNETAVTIDVMLAGRPNAVPAGSTLADVVTSSGRSPAAVSTSINGDFVPRAARSERVLQPGDVVLFFEPIVGG